MAEEKTKFYWTGEPGYVVTMEEGMSIDTFKDVIASMEELRKGLEGDKNKDANIQAAQQAFNAPASDPIPVGGDDKCEKCGSDMKYIPAGTSKKTGKPYPAFWTCQNQNCSHTKN